jgi:hypothetical protein
MNETNAKIPKWFWAAAILLLIWNLMGLINFFQHLFITEETLKSLSEGNQNIIKNMTPWVYVVFGIAVFTGFGGSVALLFKRKAATVLFITSLLASLIQMGRSIINHEYDYFGTAETVTTILILALLVLAIWLSKHATNKNWNK